MARKNRRNDGAGGDIASLVTQVSPAMRTFRRQMHQTPEVMFEEHQTAALIRGQLDRLGVAYLPAPSEAPTATIACIGDPQLPCIALRADIDALPITEATGAAYASTIPGRMHACGHDGHTAALLGAAAVFKKIERSLDVCVKLIFQPAEEGGGGAERLVRAGVMDGRLGPKPLAIFGLHGWPGIPLGKVATRPGPLLASTDNFSATFVGKGTHGAFPHLGRDPIVATCAAVLSLQQVVSRDTNPVESVVVTVGMITGGTAVNIIPPTATIEGTARTLTHQTRQAVQEAMRRRLAGVAMTHDVQLQFVWSEGYPPTVNTPEMADYVREVAKDTFGADAFVPAAAPSMGGEDFAYYLEKVPGCFTLIGLCPEGSTDCPGLHNPSFDFNDDALPVAIQLLVSLATQWTQRSGASPAKR